MWKFLSFCLNHYTYQFACLPFGLATSPREFNKLLRQVVQLQGVCLHICLNDWLIRALSPQLASFQAQLVIWVLHHLGWLINFDNPGISVHWNALPNTGFCGGSPAADENQSSSLPRSLEIRDNCVSFGPSQNDGHHSIHGSLGA